MEINSKAPVIARHEIMIRAPLATVWHILSDIDRWSTWNPDASQAKLEGLLTPGAVFRWKSGGLSIVSTLQEVEPQHRISWIGKMLGTRAVHIWLLEPRAEGVLVRTEESLDGWLVRPLRGTMQRMLDRSLQAGLEQLKRKAEEAA